MQFYMWVLPIREAWQQLLFLEAQLPAQPHTRTDSANVEGRGLIVFSGRKFVRGQCPKEMPSSSTPAKAREQGFQAHPWKIGNPTPAKPRQLVPASRASLATQKWIK